MAKVLKVSSTKKGFVVTTDIGEYTFNEEVIVEFFITKGKEFSKDEFDKILDFSDESKYYLKALNYLSFKERTIYEMNEYLLSKGLIDTENVMNKLLEKGLLNDSLYAEHFYSYTINNLKGSKYFEMELKKKRVKFDIIDEVLVKFTFEVEYDTLHQLFMKTVKNKSVSYNKYKRQLMDKFIRSGFKIGVINEMFSNQSDYLREHCNEEEALLKDYNKVKHFSRDKVISKLMQKGYNYGKIKDIID